MSATNRESERQSQDFYPTPLDCIDNAIQMFFKLNPICYSFLTVLDPCAGSRPYQISLNKLGINKVWNLDIRTDAKPDVVVNYLTYRVPFIPHLIISNPPYLLAKEFIEKSLNDVCIDGYVIMLLRLNFFGSQKRLQFWKANPAKYTFVHSKRPSFRKEGGTDATEYMHCCWQRGYTGVTNLYVI